MTLLNVHNNIYYIYTSLDIFARLKKFKKILLNILIKEEIFNIKIFFLLIHILYISRLYILLLKIILMLFILLI